MGEVGAGSEAVTALTRRRLETENLESWGLFDGDVMVGGLTKINGTGGKDLWQWSCGFIPAGTAGLGTAPATDHDRDAGRMALPASLYGVEVRDVGCPLQTANAKHDWPVAMFCGAEITIERSGARPGRAHALTVPAAFKKLCQGSAAVISEARSAWVRRADNRLWIIRTPTGVCN